MNDRISFVAERRALELRKSLKRHKLTFVQCGTNFEVVRKELLDSLNGTVVSVGVDQFHDVLESLEFGPLVLTDLELLCRKTSANGMSLGVLRSKVNEILENGTDVCLVSRSPKVAFEPVPGSSVINDSAQYYLETLSDDERGDGKGSSLNLLPEFDLNHEPDVVGTLSRALHELGVEVLAALDDAIFDAQRGIKFVRSLDDAYFDAMRGAGFARVIEGRQVFSLDCEFRRFKDSLANVLADIVAPQSSLAGVSNGLWLIERLIRRRVRDEAIGKFGYDWRKSVLHGDLPEKCLKRAREEANVTARGVAELRDPVEWLSLGELLEIVRSKQFDGLGLDGLFWDRFTRDVLPIRNRLAHMRLLKRSDQDIVDKWTGWVSNSFLNSNRS